MSYELSKLMQKLPPFPFTIDPVNKTIKITRPELQAWKRKLLRTIPPRIMELYYGRLTGICGIISNGIHKTPGITFRQAGDISWTITYNMQTAAHDWPHYSGDPIYPIPATTGDDPSFTYYDDTVRRWAGKSRKLRISLLQHWITSIPVDGVTLPIKTKSEFLEN